MRWIVPALLLAGLSGCGSRPAEPAAPPREGPAVLTAQTRQGPVTISLELAPGRPLLSDQATLRITIARDNGLDLLPTDTSEALQDFLLRDFEEALPRIDGDRVVVTHIYKLEPLKSGTLTIGPIEFRFSAADREEPLIVLTDPLDVEVGTLLETPEPTLADLAAEAEPVDLPPDPRVKWYWIGGSLLALAAIGLLLLRRKKKAAVEPPPPSAAEVARTELQALREAGLAGSDVKQFYVCLTGIVRRYVEAITGVRAPEQTTDEFLREMDQRQLFSPAVQQRFRDFLESSDLVKYAAHTPAPEDIEASLDRAAAFITELEVFEVAEREPEPEAAAEPQAPPEAPREPDAQAADTDAGDGQSDPPATEPEVGS